MKLKNATIIIDLTGSEKDILKSFSKSARRGINKGIKSNLKILEDSDIEDFYQRYLDFMKAKELILPKKETFQKNIIKNFEIKKEGKIIAGIGLDKKGLGNTPRTEYIYTTPELKNINSSELLIWRCVEWAKKKGYKQLDLGGYALKAKENEKGINRFKEKFGKVKIFYEKAGIYKYLKCNLVRNSNIMYKINKILRREKNKIKRK